MCPLVDRGDIFPLVLTTSLIFVLFCLYLDRALFRTQTDSKIKAIE